MRSFDSYGTRAGKHFAGSMSSLVFGAPVPGDSNLALGNPTSSLAPYGSFIISLGFQSRHFVCLNQVALNVLASSHDSSHCFVFHHLTIICFSQCEALTRTGLVQGCNLQSRCPPWSLELLRRAILISH